ncbi:MAG: TIGR02206 family membrane protein [Woeseiaceae bacterium]|nr:TIGR02206 family membrane protein [Woeseiaceae bacterium]
MSPFNLLSPSHIIVCIMCFVAIVYIPKYFKNSTDTAKLLLSYSIIFLMLINQGMDFYREGYLDEWKLGLPLHLCDFASLAGALYLLTKKREFFLFAFFFGIAGGTMSILTPDVIYGFPHVPYIQNEIGHLLIILPVSYGIIIDNQRPYLKDCHRVLIFASFLLAIMYLVNYLLGPPANYWYLAEKPIGDNITSFMRPEPFHVIDLYALAVILVYLMYSPYYLKDRSKQ